MKLLLVLFLCQLSAPISKASLYGFGKVSYIDGIESKLRHHEPPDSAKQLSPVILVPGDGGSQIEAKLDVQNAAHSYCVKKTDDFFNIWLNREYLVPFAIDCLVSHLRLVYNNDTRETVNSDGVTTRVPGWGNTSSVEWIDPTQGADGAYFVNLANALVRNGYKRGLSLFGAPYDFRKGPHEDVEFRSQLKELVEQVFASNNKTAVTLIVHGAGGPKLLHFLQEQPQEWKDKHVKRMVSLNGAWGGTVQSIETYTVGDDFGLPYIEPSSIGNMEKTYPSLARMMPSPLFWKPHSVLAKTRNRVYTLENVRQFFNDLDFLEGWEMYQDAMPYVLNFSAPGVEVHCIYGSNVETVESLNFNNTDDITGTPIYETGDGDGTVNKRSLEACKHWAGEQKKPVVVKSYAGNDHMGILANLTVLDDIVLLLLHDLD
uniref:Group XV phospholipase A2 n=1 Tax=Culex pipiens TaxID=7175 RepID=A0A8D8A832_CULPI